MWEIPPHKSASSRQPHWRRHLAVKRPTRAVEELHQVAATRTERGLYILLVGEPSQLLRIFSGRSACSRAGTTMRAEIAASFFETEISDFSAGRRPCSLLSPADQTLGPTRRRALGY